MAENNMNLIVLRLEGVMQSWGESSKWNHRASSRMPTKSGVIGMIACAMGLEREDNANVELNNAITMAVRADRPGKLVTDFQTVTGFPLLTIDGKPRSNGNTFISRREYLQDACFTVILKVDAGWADRIIEALQNPVWPIYLGRKSCIPSRPILVENTTEYDSLRDALLHYPASERCVLPMVYELEMKDDSLSSYNRSDHKISVDRDFISRQVWHGMIRRDDYVSVQD